MWQDATKLKKILILINLFGNNGFTHEKCQYVQSKKGTLNLRKRSNLQRAIVEERDYEQCLLTMNE